MRTLLTTLACVALVGCANRRDTVRIVAVKETIWGVKVGTAPSGGTPAFQIGLVRSFWQEVPVGTNAMYAPDYQAAVDADVKLNHQVVSEAFRSGRGVVVTNSTR